jgi:enoyl-CoA hydratase/carnithine racemase
MADEPPAAAHGIAAARATGPDAPVRHAAGAIGGGPLDPAELDAPDGIALSIDGPVATVCLQRPAKLNALSPAMLEALEQAAIRIEADERLRCVILTAAGTRAFCVGADILAWSALDPLAMWRSWVRRGHQVFDRWARLRLPVVAALNGHAFGGGLELAITADIRVCVPAAQFALPETGIATCPGWSGTQRLTGLIGAGAVKLMALTGRRIGADEALRCGLVQLVAHDGDGLAAARAVAAEIVARAPVAVQLTKQLIDAAAGQGGAAAIEAMAGALSATTHDAAEGLASFRERRPARFEGR